MPYTDQIVLGLLVAGLLVEPALLVGRGTRRLRVTDRIYGGAGGMRNVASVGVELAVEKWR